VAARTCKHPAGKRRPGPDAEHLRCTACGRVFRPRGAPVRHGTYLGYSKHERLRDGEWSWPACGPCQQAIVSWRDEYAHQPAVVKRRRVRTAARAAALGRLSRVFPGPYTVVYLEELERRSGGGVAVSRELPMWDDVIGHLVRAATGRDEWTMAALVRRGAATDRETGIMRQVARLRLLLARMTWEAGHGGAGG
jgi:hypothetical protein